MLSLEGRRWGKFRIGELFEIVQGKCSNASELKRDNPTVPYLGATRRNNAVLDFVDADEKLMQKGNCIAFIKDGEGSMGYSVYKAEDFIATTNIALGYAPFLNRYTGIFITVAADKVRGRYSYNYKRNEERLKNEMIQLPVDEAGNPDWSFMEAFMREREQAMLREYVAEVRGRIEDREALTLEGVRWECFILGEVFDIKQTANGIDKINLVQGEGLYPYITRSSMNNGVNMLVPLQEGYRLNDGNCIAVGLDTQTAFYQPTEFYTGQNIQILRHERMNEYSGKFLLSPLKKTLSIYSWGGNGATLTRLRRSKIFLPVNGEGQPDWAFMEDYMQGQEQAMLRKYLAYLESRLEQ
ncbi:MAG: restriction endonuclease subunit S [Synergistaceae bacterium]|nr:restriction endonuclease subunit S [Synergistaceae bacterium]